MKLTDIVVPEAIVPELSSTQREEAVAELIDALLASGVAGGGAPRDELIDAVLEREKIGSTGFGRGVAVPHVKHESVPRIAAAIGLSKSGIDFQALDKQPVYSIFLLLSPASEPEEHLQAMEVIFKNLSLETFRRFLRQAKDVEDVKALLSDADAQQLAT